MKSLLLATLSLSFLLAGNADAGIPISFSSEVRSLITPCEELFLADNIDLNTLESEAPSTLDLLEARLLDRAVTERFFSQPKLAVAIYPVDANGDLLNPQVDKSHLNTVSTRLGSEDALATVVVQNSRSIRDTIADTVSNLNLGEAQKTKLISVSFRGDPETRSAYFVFDVAVSVAEKVNLAFSSNAEVAMPQSTTEKSMRRFADHSFLSENAILATTYLKNKKHNATLKREAITYKANSTAKARAELASVEVQAFEEMISDLDTLDAKLKELQGSGLGSEVYGLKSVVVGRYEFRREELNARHTITITRPTDGFKWTIGVRNAGSFIKDGNSAPVLGFFHVGMNGTLADALEALETTKELFPRITPP